jgi:type II secretory pathway predicted ATPase ExeA
MYEHHFGLTCKPFSLLPDPAFLFLGKHHRHALTLLEYALTHATGFALVTGEIGSGKTTLIRHLLEKNLTSVRFGLIANTHKGIVDILPWAAQSLGLRSSDLSDADLYADFNDLLLAEYAAGRRVVLVADEAQNLSADALEQLRVLSNINGGSDLLLQTILVGQPNLSSLIRHPNLEQLAQRISVQYHVGELRRDETREYVRHRLRVAGGAPTLFEAAAVDLVYTSARGIPRVINTLCDAALVYAFAEQRVNVNLEIVEQVLLDRSTSVGGCADLRATPVS